MKQSLHMLARDWRSGELRVLALALVIAVAALLREAVPHSFSNRDVAHQSFANSSLSCSNELSSHAASRTIGTYYDPRPEGFRLCHN